VRRAYALAVVVALFLMARPVAADPSAPSDAETLAARQHAVDRHLLRVQQARFEAAARGDDPRRVKRLDKEFHRTQVRRRDLARTAEQAAQSD
jgi:hypothetical protein